MKSRVKTWQVRGIWSQQLEHKQVQQWGRNQVSRRVTVPCWHATPVANPFETQDFSLNMATHTEANSYELNTHIWYILFAHCTSFLFIPFPCGSFSLFLDMKVIHVTYSILTMWYLYCSCSPPMLVENSVVGQFFTISSLTVEWICIQNKIYFLTYVCRSVCCSLRLSMPAAQNSHLL